MKNLLKKLHITSNPQSEDVDGSPTSSKSSRFSDISSPDRLSQSQSNNNLENKPLSAISGWLNSVTNRRSPSSRSPSRRSSSPIPQTSSNVARVDRIEQPDSALNTMMSDSESSNSRDPDVEEEYQIQLALALSAREDPEAFQIEAVKQISLGSCPPENTPAEVVAFRYWNYNALSYDDKIPDGFYDLYGILTESTSSKMPSLVDLQGTPVSNNITWEAVLVNKATDNTLSHLEQKALMMAVKSKSESLNDVDINLVQKLAVLVSDHMGGQVRDPDNMLMVWRSHSSNLKASLTSMVLPLGSLTVGLARHRALLLKVLADTVGIPCRLVKGKQYTGSDDVAMNFVRIHGREYIVDLMADPGTLIPSDTSGSHVDHQRFSGTRLEAIDSPLIVASVGGVAISIEQQSKRQTAENICRSIYLNAAGDQSDERREPVYSVDSLHHNNPEEGSQKSSGRSHENVGTETVQENPHRPNHSNSHARSPSWNEGVSSPAARKMKLKDVSRYMINAAKENPGLAKKLHDVLLESGVVAPPDLFTEVYQEEANATVERMSAGEDDKSNRRRDDTSKSKVQGDLSRPQFLPPLPNHGAHSKGGHNAQSVSKELGQQVFSQSDVAPAKYVKNVPVAAAAAAAAAVVASSMVAAVARTTNDTNLELPVTAAATATAAAAAVVATTAAVSKQYENLDAHSPSAAPAFNPLGHARIDGDADLAVCEQRVGGDQKPDVVPGNPEDERISDKSTGNDSIKSDSSLDEVADCEIPWEDIILGERIGLGSYGEVYRGDWHGTEVAVKKFLDQKITVESLEEFKSEVRIMRRVRHPNVVLFMGAVTRAPNLSIVTEFLPRGSLYRLIHRPNNQLDIRRRLKMALDAARGMNYLHNCTPVIVHRDLKSPNLLVDKNWVVKVCDFGLSRMKHSTFLSSRSTAGTAEWMAPEVLRNEPSDEKCDVYSYGVILWELCTLRQPWGGMNPMQVVGAVGFQHRRLDIPDDIDPCIADIIRKCWQTDPKQRPSFAEIMAALKPLQNLIGNSQGQRASVSTSSGQEKGLLPPQMLKEPPPPQMLKEPPSRHGNDDN